MLKTNTKKSPYKQLCKEAKEAALYQSALRLLEWDQETYMPKEGLSLRALQNQTLQEKVHKLKTSSRYAKLLEALRKEKNLSFEEKVCLREWERDYSQTKNLSLSFVKKMADTTTHALAAWKEAKKNRSFKTFAPHLKKIVSLLQKKADLLGYKEHPYDALLDLFEPGMTTREIDPLFTTLKGRTNALLKKIANKTSSTKELQGPFPINIQKDLCHDVVERMGLPKERYNLAETTHPFCLGLSPDDIRLTTHYYEDNFLKGFLAAVHEAGHGLYEAGFPKEHFGTPLAEAASYGIHESQSRIWETCIAHAKSFWQFYFPKCQKAFPKALASLSEEEFYQSINLVKPSLIRIFADEVTYNLHIILRYELEKDLISGALSVDDIPDLWESKMQESLGIKPAHDSEGCLQDIHWSLGYMGYFPSYTLGNLYAGTLFAFLQKTYPDWQQRVASGDFLFIKEFLEEHIHKHGRAYTPVELIEKATKESFSSEPYLRYLEAKYPL